MLRLGSKHDFEILRSEALFRLRAEFPTTFEGWVKAPSPGGTHITLRPGFLFDVVNLALEQGLLSILPNVYFWCMESNENIVGFLTLHHRVCFELLVC